MITLPTNHPYFFTCPSCGCKLISVSSGVKAKPHCPECDYSADDAFVVKDHAIKKVQKALDANDAGTAMQLGENLSCALRDGGYQVTNAVEVDE